MKSRRQRDYASGQDKGLSLSLSFNDEIRCRKLQGLECLHDPYPYKVLHIYLGKATPLYLGLSKEIFERNITSSVKVLLFDSVKYLFPEMLRESKEGNFLIAINRGLSIFRSQAVKIMSVLWNKVMI